MRHWPLWAAREVGGGLLHPAPTFSELIALLLSAFCLSRVFFFYGGGDQRSWLCDHTSLFILAALFLTCNADSSPPPSPPHPTAPLPPPLHSSALAHSPSSLSISLGWFPSELGSVPSSLTLPDVALLLSLDKEQF